MHSFILIIIFFSFFSFVNTAQQNLHSIPPALPNFMLTQPLFEFYTVEIRKACASDNIITKQDLITLFTAYKHKAIAFNTSTTPGPEKIFTKWLKRLNNAVEFRTITNTIASTIDEYYFDEQQEIQRYIQALQACITTAQILQNNLSIYQSALTYYKNKLVHPHNVACFDNKIHELQTTISTLEQQMEALQKKFRKTLDNAYTHSQFKKQESNITILEIQGERFGLTPKFDFEIIILLNKPNKHGTPVNKYSTYDTLT